MPCRKRKASRMLLLPLAFVPTITVNGPKRSVSSAKFFEVDETKRGNHDTPPN